MHICVYMCVYVYTNNIHHSEPLALFSPQIQKPTDVGALSCKALGGPLTFLRQQGGWGWQSSLGPALLQTSSAAAWVPRGASLSVGRAGTQHINKKVWVSSPHSGACSNPLKLKSTSPLRQSNLICLVCNVIWRLSKNILLLVIMALI